MDYDTYGSSAVELAIDLANADLDPDDGVPGVNHSSWELRKAAAHAGSVRSVLASSMANSTALDP